MLCLTGRLWGMSGCTVIIFIDASLAWREGEEVRKERLNFEKFCHHASPLTLNSPGLPIISCTHLYYHFPSQLQAIVRKASEASF
jgi:hypothetical protein